ncbi:MAG TPA: pantoate--beta-alanine ligase [Tepidisphaeraceae bacterium]|nr:pantoate--beta-alanine ligase [Tepidisphaeraceae bacterium]
MIVVRTIADCRAARSGLGKLALVPTMGALHAGHVSLMEIARKHAPHVAVSIFVNPTQFGPREDFNKYPRPIEKDLEMCEKAGVDLVFNPDVKEMYPDLLAGATPLAFRPSDGAGAVPPEAPPPEIVVDLPVLSSVLEGRFRAGHFRGVCQVVAKLFNIIRPDVACFGMKDFQQLRILEAMTQALNWDIKIVACPTLREKDGLAMSSRNRYLSDAERQRALAISRGLFLAKGDFDSGVRQANRLVTIVQKTLLDAGTLGKVPVLIDYVAAVNAETLKTVDVVNRPTVIAVAARVGGARLIDNILLAP